MTVKPTYVSKGTPWASTGAVLVPAPDGVGHPPDRLLLCLVETANQPLPSHPLDGNGNDVWIQLAEINNGGAGGVANSLRAYLFYKWGSGTEDPANDGLFMPDAGTNQYGHIFAFDDVDPLDPFSAVATAVQAPTTAVVCPGVTTDQDNSLVCFFTAMSGDGNSTANLSAPTNANLIEIVERHDQRSSAGVGGGVALVTGFKESAGDTGDLTQTGVSQAWVHITVALNPGPDKAKVEQLEAEVWGVGETSAVIEQLSAEIWFTIQNAARIYQLEAELWYIAAPEDDGRRMSLM